MLRNKVFKILNIMYESRECVAIRPEVPTHKNVPKDTMYLKDMCADLSHYINTLERENRDLKAKLYDKIKPFEKEGE